MSQFNTGDIVFMPVEPDWYLRLGKVMRSVVRFAYRISGKNLVRLRKFEITEHQFLVDLS